MTGNRKCPGKERLQKKKNDCGKFEKSAEYVRAFRFKTHSNPTRSCKRCMYEFNMAEEGTKNSTTTATTTRTCTCSCCDFPWTVTTMEGWLKLVEAIMTFLTFVICASFPGSYRAEYEFLIFVATTAFIFVVLHIILRMTHLFEKLPPEMRHPILGLASCFLAALALLIGSAVVYARGEEYYIPTLKTTGVCGFISAALFFFEGVYFVILYRRAPKRQAEQKTTEEEVEVDDFLQQPSKPLY